MTNNAHESLNHPQGVICERRTCQLQGGQHVTGLILGLCPANERLRYLKWQCLSLAGRKPRISPGVTDLPNVKHCLMAVISVLHDMIHVPTIVIVESTCWLLMAWHLFGTRASATTIADISTCRISGAPQHSTPDINSLRKLHTSQTKQSQW